MNPKSIHLSSWRTLVYAFSMMKHQVTAMFATFWLVFSSIVGCASTPNSMVSPLPQDKDPSISPVVQRTGTKIKVDWSGIQQRIAQRNEQSNALQADLSSLRASLYVNGIETIRDLPWGKSNVELTEPTHGQMDYYVVHRLGERIVDISYFSMKETYESQVLLAESFTKRFPGEAFQLIYPASLKAQGLSEDLTANAIRLGYKKIVWVLAPNASNDVKRFIAEAKDGVDVLARFSPQGAPTQVDVVARTTKEVLATDAKNFFIKVDAAFSGNAFFWDDMLVALSTVPHHPALAEATVRFWLMVQERNGGVIPREVRKENLLSLWFTERIRDGEFPRTNLIYTNPYLMNWVADALYRQDPSTQNLQLLKDVSSSITRYSKWMEENRAVKNKDGAIVGFNGSSLGTGADTSRGELGNFGEPEAYETGFVDFISQQISMFKDQARWARLFAERERANRNLHLRVANEAQANADRYTKVLNDLYWNEERASYFDIRRSPAGDIRQILDYQPIASFWPLYAGAVEESRVEKFVNRQLTDDTFGGDFPFPANARNSIRPDQKVYYKPRPNYRDEDGYWDKWAHWPSMAMVAIEGLRRSGRPDLAHIHARNYLQKMAETSTQTVFENYGEVESTLPGGRRTYRSRPGQHAEHKVRADFAGWSKGPPVYLALEDVVGLHARQDGVLDWALRTELKIGEAYQIHNLQHQGFNVSLKLSRTSAEQYSLDIETSGPLRIQLRSLVDTEGKLHASSRREARLIQAKPKKGKQTFQLRLETLSETQKSKAKAS